MTEYASHLRKFTEEERAQIREDLNEFDRKARECCCENAECTDFEDQMARWGILLEERLSRSL